MTIATRPSRPHRAWQHPVVNNVLATTFFVGRRRRIWSDLTAAAGVTPGDDVLDVHCGTGYFTELLSAAAFPGGTVTGVDPSQAMIDYCRRHAPLHARYQIAAAERLPFDDFTFDVVVSSLALHRVAPTDRTAAVAEMFHVLRPGGRLLIADTRLSEHELHTLVDAAGLSVTGAGSYPLLRYVTAVRPEQRTAGTISVVEQRNSVIVPAADIDRRYSVFQT